MLAHTRLIAGFSRPEVEIVRRELGTTSFRGWAVLLLFRAQGSSVILISYTFGLFLPFIREDLDISPLEAGLLQGVWWVTAAIASLPFGVWFSRIRPVLVVSLSLFLSIPFLFVQAFATGFPILLLARFAFVGCHVMTVPARTLLLQQWAAPRQFAQINAVGLSQHSLMLALAVSTSAIIITELGSWRMVYMILGGMFILQTSVWLLIAKEDEAPVEGFQSRLEEQEGTPLHALYHYPQGWVIAVVMFFLSATWTSLVTFLPTFWLEERGVPLILGGPLLGFLYYALIPTALLGGFLAKKIPNRKLLLGIPALFNALFGVGIILSGDPVVLMFLITGLGLAWVFTPAINVLPFEFPDISPREVAVISSLVVTFSALGFAAGPTLVGIVAQSTGSLETGLLTMCLLTASGVLAAGLYPVRSGNASEA